MNKTRHKSIIILLLLSIVILIYDFFSTNTPQKEIKSNQIQHQNSSKQDRLLTLVNHQNKIPKDWQVDLVTLNHNQSIDKSAYDDLMNMLEDAKKDGMHLLICSSYRTNEKQNQLFQNKVNQYIKQGYTQTQAQQEATHWVARAGTSEHQLGLAIDIVSIDNQRLDSSQEKTQEQKWLMKNSWKYGFILRYPASKDYLIGIGYEPWHYRYVGKQHSQKIYESGLCLEEYVKR